MTLISILMYLIFDVHNMKVSLKRHFYTFLSKCIKCFWLGYFLGDS